MIWDRLKFWKIIMTPQSSMPPEQRWCWFEIRQTWISKWLMRMRQLRNFVVGGQVAIGNSAITCPLLRREEQALRSFVLNLATCCATLNQQSWSQTHLGLSEWAQVKADLKREQNKNSSAAARNIQQACFWWSDLNSTRISGIFKFRTCLLLFALSSYLKKHALQHSRFGQSTFSTHKWAGMTQEMNMLEWWRMTSDALCSKNVCNGVL